MKITFFRIQLRHPLSLKAELKIERRSRRKLKKLDWEFQHKNAGVVMNILLQNVKTLSQTSSANNRFALFMVKPHQMDQKWNKIYLGIMWTTII